MSFLIACCSIALRNRPAEYALNTIADAGFGGIEFLYPHVQGLNPSGLKSLAGQARARNVEIPVISPYFIFTRGPEQILHSLRVAEEALNIASLLGARKIRTFIDIGGDGLPSHRANDAIWKEATRGLQQLCDMDSRTEFVVETHEDTLADTVPSVRRLLDEVARPNLKINFQANRDFLQRGFMESLVELLPSVSHMHWQQHQADGHETYLEEPGLVDFQQLIAFLNEKEYQGTASVEYCWPDAEESRIASAGRFLAGR